MAGSRALIIGGIGGIGRAIAASLARDEHARVALLGRDESRLQAVASELGPGVSWHSADVADAEAGAISHLVSPAASYVPGQVLHVNGGWWLGS